MSSTVPPATDPVLTARAAVLADLAARDLVAPATVDVVEDVVTARRWWVRQWPAGAELVAGQIAQDVQDRLLDAGSRWPACTLADCPVEALHTLHVEPDLGADPHWVCEHAGVVLARVGSLPPAPKPDADLD